MTYAITVPLAIAGTILALAGASPAAHAQAAAPPGGPATTRPAGSPILSDADAAARVARSSWEPRPANAGANSRRPTGAELAAFQAASRGQSFHASKVTGAFTGTTDEILQWAAHKWGLDENLVRATAHKESTWRQNAHGDRGNGESYGLMQVKSRIWRGTSPLAGQSTAFNVDMYGAVLRHCYDGKETWMLRRGYAAGDLWGCVGWYFSGNWKDGGATTYASIVRGYVSSRPWLRY